MDLITPGIGLVFWTTVVFVILLIVLKKFAWKPILEAVKSREENIENALQSAEQAKADLEKLQANNEALLKEAREERDAMLTEAKEAKDKIIAEAKSKANEESERMIEAAKEVIKNEKLAAVTEVKNVVAQMSITIAEKVIKENLSGNDKQQAYVEKLLQEAELN